MRVVYVSHTSRVSGAERSLLDLLRGLPPEIEASVAAPPGELADAVRRAGIPVHPIRGTDASLKLHPKHTPATLADLGRAGLQLGSVVRRLRPDVVHANSVRAGMAMRLAASRRRSRVIVHVRDRLPAGFVASASMSVAAHGADVVVANSAYTAASISPGVNDRVRVVHNGVDLERFDPESIDRLAARERLGLGGSPDPVLSIIAQITPWKGQEEAIRATAELAQQGRPTTLLIAGAPKFTSAATRYDNIAYLSRLEGLVEELRLGDRVKFLGEIQDTPLVLSASDVVLVPSWAEPFGRTVIEAMAMATPVVATGVGGPNEIITHGHDGLLVPVRNPGALADAVAHLLSDGKLAAAIGDAARARARDFSLQEHVGAIVGLYRNGG